MNLPPPSSETARGSGSSGGGSGGGGSGGESIPDGVGSSSGEYHPPNFPPASLYEVPLELMPTVHDKRVRGLATWIVRANASVKGRQAMKASDFQRWINSELIPNQLPCATPRCRQKRPFPRRHQGGGQTGQAEEVGEWIYGRLVCRISA